MPRHHALDDGADSAPRDAHGFGHHRLACLLGQIGHVVLKVTREPYLRVSPRDHLDDHAAPGTVHPAQGIAQQHLHPAHVQMPPVPRPRVEHAMDPTPTAGTVRNCRRRRHVSQYAKQIEFDCQDTGMWNLKKVSE